MGAFRRRTALAPQRASPQVFRGGQKNRTVPLMGKRGPKPKPNEERLLEGNPGKRPMRVDRDEDDLSSGGLRMPTRMTEMERQVWRDTLESFPSWYFRSADKILLIAYCRAVVRLEKSEKALQNKSAVLQRANGSPCLSPHIAIINSAMAQVIHLSEVLGLTRSKRKGVVASTVPQQPSTPGVAIPDTLGGDEHDIPDDLIAPPMVAPSA